MVARRGLDQDGVTVRVYRERRRGGRASPRWPSDPALPAPRPVLFGAGPREVRTAVLFPSWHEPGHAEAAGAARPVRRPARAAGAGGPFGLPDRAVVRRAGVRRGHRRRPGHARARAAVGARGSRRPGRTGPGGPGGRAARGGGPVRRPGHGAGGDPRLVVRRLPGRAGGAAPPGRVPRGDRGRAGHRLAPLRHPLHRALPGASRSGPGAVRAGLPDQSGRTGAASRARSC